jgi:hypothetical protein
MEVDPALGADIDGVEVPGPSELEEVALQQTGWDLSRRKAVVVAVYLV